MEEKIKNRIDDLHYKAITKLVDENQIILIPRLNTKRIVERADMNRRSKRIINQQRHGKLIKRLQEKGEIKCNNIVIVSEYLTSQMCGKCFNKKKIKGKDYICEKCGLEIDRDINGARNIYIKYISENME
jgi:putative transposase